MVLQNSSQSYSNSTLEIFFFSRLKEKMPFYVIWMGQEVYYFHCLHHFGGEIKAIASIEFCTLFQSFSPWQIHTKTPSEICGRQCEKSKTIRGSRVLSSWSCKNVVANLCIVPSFGYRDGAIWVNCEGSTMHRIVSSSFGFKMNETAHLVQNYLCNTSTPSAHFHTIFPLRQIKFLTLRVTQKKEWYRDQSISLFHGFLEISHLSPNCFWGELTLVAIGSHYQTR